MVDFALRVKQNDPSKNPELFCEFFIENKKYPETLRACLDQAQSGSANLKVLKGVAVAAFRSQNLEMAKDFIQRVLKVFPDDAIALNNIAFF